MTLKLRRYKHREACLNRYKSALALAEKLWWERANEMIREIITMGGNENEGTDRDADREDP